MEIAVEAEHDRHVELLDFTIHDGYGELIDGDPVLGHAASTLETASMARVVGPFSTAVGRDQADR